MNAAIKHKLLIILLFTSILCAQNNAIDFNLDKRLFISYVFMNAAGNEGEWRKEGMNPVRVEIRKYLDENMDASFKNDISKYVNSNGLESWVNYGPYALINNGPPAFEIFIDYKNSRVDSNFVLTAKGLQKYFVEFYKNYDIEGLWNKYFPQMQKVNDKYKPFADKALTDIINYLRIRANYFSKEAKKIYYQEIPLMSYFTAQTVKVNGAIYIISGPNDGQPSEANFYHEALHHPVGECINRYSGLIDKYSSVNELNQGELGYQNWRDFFEECLVRTIDLRLSAKVFKYSEKELEKAVHGDYKKGLILSHYFNGELKKYEKSKMSIDKYFPRLITNLDFTVEKERLKRYNKSKVNDPE